MYILMFQIILWWCLCSKNITTKNLELECRLQVTNIKKSWNISVILVSFWALWVNVEDVKFKSVQVYEVVIWILNEWTEIYSLKIPIFFMHNADILLNL